MNDLLRIFRTPADERGTMKRKGRKKQKPKHKKRKLEDDQGVAHTHNKDTKPGQEIREHGSTESTLGVPNF